MRSSNVILAVSLLAVLGLAAACAAPAVAPPPAPAAESTAAVVVAAATLPPEAVDSATPTASGPCSPPLPLQRRQATMRRRSSPCPPIRLQCRGSNSPRSGRPHRMTRAWWAWRCYWTISSWRPPLMVIFARPDPGRTGWDGAGQRPHPHRTRRRRGRQRRPGGADSDLRSAAGRTPTRVTATPRQPRPLAAAVTTAGTPAP